MARFVRLPPPLPAPRVQQPLVLLPVTDGSCTRTPARTVLAAAAPCLCLQDPQLLQDAVDTGNAPRLALLLQHPQLDTSGMRLYKAVGAVPGDQLARLAKAGYNVNVQREEGCLLVHRAVQARFRAGGARAR